LKGCQDIGEKRADEFVDAAKINKKPSLVYYRTDWDNFISRIDAPWSSSIQFQKIQAWLCTDDAFEQAMLSGLVDHVGRLVSQIPNIPTLRQLMNIQANGPRTACDFISRCAEHMHPSAFTQFFGSRGFDIATNVARKKEVIETFRALSQRRAYAKAK